MEFNAKRATVAIVGGGIIGLSSAWRLAQAGLSVTVYEKGHLGGEASWAGAGMLAPGGEFEQESSIARMALESRDLYPRFVEELQHCSGLEIDFQETGALDIAYSAGELQALEGRAERQLTMGIPSKRLGMRQITTFWPRLRADDLAGGYFYPGDALVNPRQIVAALRVCCTREGVRVLEESTVNGLEVSAAGVQADGAFFDFAVVASGAWSGFLQVGGVPALPASEPVRGHLVGYQQPQQICNTIIRHGHTYLLQRANGFLITGATVERVGFDSRVNPAAAAELTKAAAYVMPHLGETSPTEIWNGFRPGSDGLHAGAWHGSRLYLAYGHFRNGILLAPATANLITSQIKASL